MNTLEQSGWRDRYLTLGWNNALTAALGLPMIAYAITVSSTSSLSDRAAFIGMFLIGAVY